MSDMAEKEYIEVWQSSDNYWWGNFVNHSITVSGLTLEELKDNAKIVFKAYINELNKIVSQDDPFELTKIPRSWGERKKDG